MKSSSSLRHFAMLAAAVLFAGSWLSAQAALGADKVTIPVPRFVTLRSDDVNVRLGPGKQYPVEWIYKKKDLPVEVVQEFDTWRKIRDSQGTEGWVAQGMISGRRSILIKGDTRAIRASADPKADIVARAEPGVMGKLLECPAEWCRIDLDGTRGWIPRNQIWGVYPNEAIP